ncbi:PAS domain-containing protein [Rhodovibrio sodomensis]|nr:PAS domain-containing protein [Rhodovibrio sodomensis]
MSGSTALLDADGRIIAVNAAWRAFADSNDGTDPNGHLGTDYLATCVEASANGDPHAARIAGGITRVMAGREDLFQHVYPCHAPELHRWFRVCVRPVAAPIGGYLVQHIDVTREITDRQTAQERLDDLRTSAAELGGYSWTWQACTRRLEIDPALAASLGLDEWTTPDLVLARANAGSRWTVLRQIAACRLGLSDELDAALAVKDATDTWHHVCVRGQTRRTAGGKLLQITGLTFDITDRENHRNRAEAADRRARLMALVAERTDNAVVVTGADGRIQWVNAGFCQLSGHSLDESIGVKPGDLLQGPDTDPQARDRLSQAIREQRGVVTEILNYTRDGHPYWIEIDLQPVFDDQGALTHFIAIERDITAQRMQRKLAEARMAALELMAAETPRAETLERVVDILAQGAVGTSASLMLKDATGTAMTVAAALGLDPAYCAALEGVAFGPRVGSCGAAIATGEPVFAADITRHPNWRPYQELIALSGMRACWSQPVVAGDDGKVLGAMAIYSRTPRSPSQAEKDYMSEAANLVSDLLLRYQARAERAANSRRMRAIAGRLPVRVAHLNPEGRITYANDAYADFYGRPAQDLVGSVTWDLLPTRARRRIEALCKRMHRDGACSAEIDLTREGRPAAETRVTLLPDLTSEGDLTGIFEMHEDLSEFRARERKTMAAMEAAQEANRAKSNFLANMSHELRTPLNAILGYTEMMRKEILGPIGNPKYGEYITDIHTSGQYLLDLLEDVLDLSRLEAGGRPLTAEAILLDEVVDAALTVLRADRDAIRTDAATGIRVGADARALQQILVNLLSNALKYGDGSPIAIEVVSDDTRVHIDVFDQGPGIDPDHLKRVMEPFYRGAADAYVAGSGKTGAGVGLALARRLAQDMGGNLCLYSTPGAGTRARITLPAA